MESCFCSCDSFSSSRIYICSIRVMQTNTILPFLAFLSHSGCGAYILVPGSFVGVYQYFRRRFCVHFQNWRCRQQVLPKHEKIRIYAVMTQSTMVWIFIVKKTLDWICGYHLILGWDAYWWAEAVDIVGLCCSGWMSSQCRTMAPWHILALQLSWP
jgi:hypothetical protein